MVVVALRQSMPTSLLIVVIGSGHHRHHQPGSFWSSVVKCGVQNCKHPHHRRQRWASSLSTRSVWGSGRWFSKLGRDRWVKAREQVKCVRRLIFVRGHALASVLVVAIIGCCPHHKRSITERETCERAAAGAKTG